MIAMMTVEQLRLVQLWLESYAPKCDKKLSQMHGDFLRGTLRCVALTIKHMEAGMTCAKAMAQADWDIWTERTDHNAMAAACFFWAMGQSLQGKSPNG